VSDKGKPYIINGERVSREEYRKKKLKSEDLRVRTQEGRKELIQAHAAVRGESMNEFINRAIEETIERDKNKASD